MTKEQAIDLALASLAGKQAAIAAAVIRDCCFHCGVRAEVHNQHGCKHYRRRA